MVTRMSTAVVPRPRRSVAPTRNSLSALSPMLIFLLLVAGGAAVAARGGDADFKARVSMHAEIGHLQAEQVEVAMVRADGAF